LVIVGFYAGNIYLLVGTETVFNQFAGSNVTHSCLVKGAQVAWRAVNKLFYLNQLAVKAQYTAVPYV